MKATSVFQAYTAVTFAITDAQAHKDVIAFDGDVQRVKCAQSGSRGVSLYIKMTMIICCFKTDWTATKESVLEGSLLSGGM